MIPRFICQIHLLKTMFKSPGGWPQIGGHADPHFTLGGPILDPCVFAGQFPEG
jgi:hypothetical protein